MYELTKKFISAIDKHVIESIDIETAHHLVETLDTMISELIKKQKEQVDILMCQQFLPNLFKYILRCLGAFSSFKLQKKQEPELISS